MSDLWGGRLILECFCGGITSVIYNNNEQGSEIQGGEKDFGYFGFSTTEQSFPTTWKNQYQ